MHVLSCANREQCTLVIYFDCWCICLCDGVSWCCKWHLTFCVLDVKILMSLDLGFVIFQDACVCALGLRLLGGVVMHLRISAFVLLLFCYNVPLYTACFIAEAGFVFQSLSSVWNGKHSCTIPSYLCVGNTLLCNEGHKKRDALVAAFEHYWRYWRTLPY